MSYESELLLLSPAHYFPLDGNTNDLGNGTATSQDVLIGSADLLGAPITKGRSNSLNTNTDGSSRKGSSPTINDGADITDRRTFFLWFRANSLVAPTCVYKQGGQNNNFMFTVGLGGGSFFAANASAAAIPFFLVNYSERQIELGREYFVVGTWEKASTTGGAGTRVRYWVNGVEQGQAEISNSVDPFPNNSGQISIGNSNQDLVFYGGQLSLGDTENLLDKEVAELTIFNNFIPTQAQIDRFWELGVLPEHTVTNQAELDILAGEINNVNCGVLVVSGSIDLDFSDIFFSNNDIDVQYNGDGVLTVRTTQKNLTYSTIGAGSIVTKLPPITISGLPTTANANGVLPETKVGVYSIDTDTWQTFLYTENLEIVLADVGVSTNYLIRADFKGGPRLPDTTISADFAGTLDLSNLVSEFTDQDGNRLVTFGVATEISRLSFDVVNQRIELKSGPISFLSVIKSVEDFTVTQSGIEGFDSSVVRQIQYLSNPYANTIVIPAGWKIRTKAGELESPILSDFVVFEASGPAVDPFEQTADPPVRQSQSKIISGTELTAGQAQIFKLLKAILGLVA